MFQGGQGLAGSPGPVGATGMLVRKAGLHIIFKLI